MEERLNKVPIPGTAFCADNNAAPGGFYGCIRDAQCILIASGGENVGGSVSLPPFNLGCIVNPLFW